MSVKINILIGLFAIMGCFGFVNSADAVWYNSNWDYKRAITLDHNQIATTTSAFPVLATSTETYLKTTTHSGKIENEYGFDIIFVDDDDSTLLNFEREKYASTTGEIAYWIKTDISSTTDKTIYMYYGNASASDTATTTGVWDDNFKGVWHLTEDPGPGGAGDIKDSTKEDNDGTAEASMTTSDQVTGQIDGSLDFDGGDDYIQIIDDKLEPDYVTVSCWLKPDTVNQVAYATPICMPDNTSHTSTWTSYGFKRNSTNSYSRVEVSVGGTKYNIIASSGTEWSDGKWSHVCFTYNGETVNLYVNTTLTGTNSDMSGVLDYGTSNYLGIGTRNIEDLGEYFKGSIDEIRISNTARTVGWIETEYNNQVSVGSFMTFGVEEAESEVGAKPQSVYWFD